MNAESLKRLSIDIGKLMDFNDEYNVIIKAGVSPNHHEFKAHSLILRARSPYFHTALSNEWARTQENIIRFEKPNISPDIFEVVLRYIYSGTFELEDQEPSDILDLLCAADELMIDELMEHIQTYLIRNQSKWIDENLIEILNIVTPRTTLSSLTNYCLEEITLLKPSIFFESESFLNMDENALVALLKRDDLGMSESKLWDYVLKWGITNTPSLSYIIEDRNIDNSETSSKENDNNKKCVNKFNKWTSEDFNSLEKTLKNCIPLIRFFHIPQDEFYRRVTPYSKILPGELLGEMVNYHLSRDSPNYNIKPPRTYNLQIDSKLINTKHAAIITSWLDGNYKSYSPRSIPYTFKLLFRASVDGRNNPNSFHSKCDNVGPTIIIIKMRNSNCLVGGYNPLNVSWKRSWFSPARGTEQCFTFSMDSSAKTILDKNVKLSQIIPEYKQYAIYDHPWDGPCFGTGPDLWVNINPKNPIGHIIKKCYQPSVMNSGVFYWEDWEVFSVQRKESA